MITSKDIFDEVETANKAVEVLGDAYKSGMVRLMSIAVKLLHNIRTNQTEIMKAQGISLKKPETIDESKI